MRAVTPAEFREDGEATTQPRGDAVTSRVQGLTESFAPSGPAADSDDSFAPWVYAAALAIWASSWNLQLSVLMRWSPVNPVWIGSIGVALCVVHRAGHPLRLPIAVTAPFALLVLGFLPGALRSSTQGYGQTKAFTLILVVLPVLCAAVLLLDNERARYCWVRVQVLVGGAVAVAAVFFNNAAQAHESGRFSLNGVDTITTARLVGGAVVVLLVAGLISFQRRWWALLLAGAGGAVVVHVGSRGPLLSILFAAVIVVLVARCLSGRRALPILVAGCGIAAAFLYARAGGGSGGARLTQSLETGFSDQARSQLLHDAVHVGFSSAWGIGWGNFPMYSRTAQEIENARGVAYAHNVFAETFVEGGVLALFAFAVFAALALHRLYRLSVSQTDTLVLGLALYWLLNAQFSSDVVGNRFMWITLASGLAAYVDRSRLRARPSQLAPPLHSDPASR
jgi:hypothetical protein